MRRFLFVALLMLVAVSAFGHAGEVHTYMGTVTMLHDDGSFMMKKTSGETIHVAVTKATAYLRADGKAAKKAELVDGRRVAVTFAKDAKTATMIKLGAVAKKKG